MIRERKGRATLACSAGLQGEPDDDDDDDRCDERGRVQGAEAPVSPTSAYRRRIEEPVLPQRVDFDLPQVRME
jgi:hypothetical protein